MTAVKTSLVIEITEHAVLIRGAIPLSLMKAVGELAAAAGKVGDASGPAWDQMSRRLPNMLDGVSFVLGSEASLKKLEATLVEQQRATLGGNPLMMWWYGPDTGLSSKYLVWWLAAQTNAVKLARPRPSFPSDLDDLGRCVRAVRAIWGALPLAMAPDGEEWAPLLRRWTEAEALVDDVAKLAPGAPLGELRARADALLGRR